MQTYPWSDALAPGDFVSKTTSYESGKYLPLFEDRVFAGCDAKVGALPYYVYDPTKHGYPKDGAYPVLFAIHGAGGSRVGKMAINWAGVEMLASPERQRELGGAYIVCPLAKDDELGSWMEPLPGGGLDGYSPRQQAIIARYTHDWTNLTDLLGVSSIYSSSLFAILDEALASFTSAGKLVLLGTSAGGYAAWRMLIDQPTRFAATIIMAGAYLPSARELAALREASPCLWLCHGVYDECVPFELCVLGALPELCQFPNATFYFPRLVRNGDHGVASNVGGDEEMGQHCINNAMQQNLIYDDGTPYDSRFPRGVTGWLKERLR